MVRARQILLALVHAIVAGTSFHADALPSDAIPTRIVGAAKRGDEAAVVAWLDGGGQVDATFKDTRQNVAVSGLTLLMAATDGGHEQLVDTLLRRGADPNQQESEGWTVLMIASAKGRMRLVQTLLWHGAECNHRNRVGATALMSATVHHHPAVVMELLLAGADTEARNGRGSTALQLAKDLHHTSCIEAIENHLEERGGLAPLAVVRAAERGEEEAVVAWLDGGGQIEAMFDNGSTSGLTLLSVTVSFGQSSLVETLLRRGANIEHQNSDGDSALMLASAKGNGQIVGILESHGADVNQVSGFGDRLVVEAGITGHERLVDVRLHKLRGVAGTTALMVAAHHNQSDIVTQLLNLGAEVKARNVYGKTALQMAKDKGNGGCVEAIEKHVAERGGLVPLNVAGAAQRGDEEAVVAWLDGGGRVDATFREGSTYFVTLLLTSAARGHERLVETLLRRGAAIDQQDSDGFWALFLAASNGRERVAHTLLLHGAEVNSQDHLGLTPLMAAAEKGHLHVVDLLLRYGADADRQELNGRTALMGAVVGNHLDVVLLLLQVGADTTVHERHDRTALQLAQEFGHTDCVAVIRKSVGEVALRRGIPKRIVRAAQRGDDEAVIGWLMSDGHPSATIKGSLTDSQYVEGTAAGFSLLMVAARKGHQRLIDKMLWCGADVNYLATSSALIEAAGHGNPEVVENLLRNGANVNAQSSGGSTALMVAAYQGHASLVRRLLWAGASLNSRDAEGLTALQMAKARGNSACVHEIERHVTATVERHVPRGLVPRKVLAAALRGDEGLFEAAIAAWLDGGGWVDGIFKEGPVSGVTLLQHAAYLGHERVVSTLLRHGAQGAALDSHGVSALMRAAGNGHERVVELLLQKRASDGPAQVLPHGPYAGVLPSALVNMQDKVGETALMRAARRCSPGHAAAVRHLLQADADVHLRSDRGLTAMDMAYNHGHTACVDAMTQHLVEKIPLIGKLLSVCTRNALTSGVMRVWWDRARGRTRGMGLLMYLSRLGEFNLFSEASVIALAYLGPFPFDVLPDIDYGVSAAWLLAQWMYFALIIAILPVSVALQRRARRLRPQAGARRRAQRRRPEASALSWVWFNTHRRRLQMRAASALVAVAIRLGSLWHWATHRRRADATEPARGQRRRAGRQGRGRDTGTGAPTQSGGKGAVVRTDDASQPADRAEVARAEEAAAAEAEARAAAAAAEAAARAEEAAARAAAQAEAEAEAVALRAEMARLGTTWHDSLPPPVPVPLPPPVPAIVAGADPETADAAGETEMLRQNPASLRQQLQSSEVRQTLQSAEEGEGPASYTDGEVEEGEETDSDGAPAPLPAPLPPADQPPLGPVSLASANFDTGRPEVPESTVGGESTCIICFTRPKSHVAIPCGHLCACDVCSARMEQCPICREPVMTWFLPSRIREA